MQRRPRARKITDREFAVVVRDFMASPKWRAYSASTQYTWARYLRLVETGLGHVSVYDIRPALVQAFLDELEGRPGVQATTLSALKQVEKHGYRYELLPGPITLGVEPSEVSEDGHKPWTDAQVQLAELHARPELARVVALAANTGQRGSDLVRMCWNDIEIYNGQAGINVRQQKTGKELWVPITAELARAMEIWERRSVTILTNSHGRPWDRPMLSLAWARERDTNRALTPLAGLVLHGLRATACVRLLRAGANTRQIADMVGLSEPMVARYTRFSSQRENAAAAVIRLDRTFGERGLAVVKKTQA